MKMEHYLAHTDYPIWEVIQKGNGPVSVSTDTNEVVKVLPPRTAEEILARERERKARTTLLMALPEDHLAKFHKMSDAKQTWDAIKSRFGGNDEFQSLLSQLEIHGAGVSSEDANQKFLRSLPPSWSQVSLVMRTKPGIDNLSFNDLYNNLRVFESNVKGSIASSSSTQNIAFVSSESTNSTNNISTACGASTSSRCHSQKENSSSYTDEILHSFFSNQSNSTKLDHEDLEQLDEFDLEEMDLKWQVAMISMRLKKFHQKTGRKLHFDAKEPVGFDKTKVECYNSKDNGRRPGKQEEPKALLTFDEEGIDWTKHANDEQEDFALMAHNNSGSDNEVISCSKECVKSYSKLKKLYDEHREQLEKIRFMKIDLDDKTDVLTYNKKLLAEAITEKEDLKAKLEQWKSSSKNIGKLLGSQMSANDKFRLRYGDHRFDGNLSYEKEMFQSVFNSIEDDVENRPLHDRFVRADEMHVKQTESSETSESDTQTSEYTSCDSDSSDNTHKAVSEPMPKQVVSEPMPKQVISTPKVWNDAPIIEEYESDSDDNYVPKDIPHKALKNKGIVDSECSRHLTGNKAYLTEYQDYDGDPVAFGGSKGYITGKGKIKTGKLDFENVSFVKELQHFNLFSVSQMCDKKNKVLFTDTECLVLSPEFKLPDENQVLFKVPRQNNMYSFNLENIVPFGGLACLIAKATVDESNKWHRRLGHVNFKTLNKLVKGNLIRGLPSKNFQNDHSCVACQKGKQHKASCKAKLVSSISQPLQLLHMDLFRPTSVRSINHKTYCLVIIDDFIRSDNGTKFKNRDMIEFCGLKGIKREYSNARTLQQNGITERKNRTLIEAARTMLANSLLPNTFWTEAVNTACYVLNRVLVTKPHNKTPYELITGKPPIISYIKPFGCHVTILNTIDQLGKFEEKADEGFLVGYSLNSKAFRVYNLETKRVEENLHIRFLENKPNVPRKGPTWLFNLDYLTNSMNYQLVTAENNANKTASPIEANESASTQNNSDAGNSEMEAEPVEEHIVLPFWPSYTSTIKSSKKRNKD
ncbi:putative ribonuclease H-like domain-containing protein [Tanacetum coccineum]|uniref:Ribonuclease H-like domain-containing protein n=1 Tax=Tanacetum coccineum TaxID=301880 RepID=A0ABQ5CG72_9ASTR